MKAIKIINAVTLTNSMTVAKKIIGKTIELSDNFDYSCDKYKVNEYRLIFGRECRLYLYPNGTIEIMPKGAKSKTILIDKYETIN